MIHRIFTVTVSFLFIIVTCQQSAESAQAPPAAESSAREQTTEDEINRKNIHQNYRMDEITVTATKTETPAAELLPVTAYTVDAKDIEAQPNYYMSNFGELIRDVPGVHVSQYYPWGPPWVQLRGTGYFIGRTVYLVDGIPVTPFVSQTINNNDISSLYIFNRT